VDREIEVQRAVAPARHYHVGGHPPPRTGNAFSGYDFALLRLPFIPVMVRLVRRFF
jgi:hypothetical protein